ncbi:PREDICTED: cytochrome P450 1A2-like [Priapulus caudatus]|uniref:Cytochrome P450 1A2-like n=1 Tax=Priapulus caudatus TaxID=37621 RepID=A0ABM1F5L6_PRICU|nr:PREDICTED: cytochrome P450 1A2-like [Priapulus caudatus]
MAVVSVATWLAPMNLAIVALALFVGYLLLRPKRWRGNPPPGPSGWPVIGSMFQLGKRPEIFLTKMSERYGDIFSLNLGEKRAVVVNTCETWAEAIIEKGHIFADRPDLFSFKLEEAGNQHHGVGFTRASEMQRKKIKVVRAALNSAIPEVAEKFNTIIASEVALLMQDVANENGKPFDPYHVIEFCYINILGMWLYGKIFQQRDEQYLKWADTFAKRLELGSCLLVDWFPSLACVTSGKAKELKGLVQTMVGWHMKLLEEHRQTLNESSPRDFLDHLLIQQQKGKLMVSDTDICCVLDDLQSAGFDTVTANTNWGIQLLVQNPDVQKKLQAEIDEVVGSGRAPTTKDRRNMPYLEATLWEIQRVGMILPMPGVRGALSDTTLGGFDIPKDTVLMANHAKMAMNPINFPQPQKFDPSRYLDENGVVVAPDKNIMLFGNGFRICPGMQLARDMMFTVMANLLQRFTFELPEGVTAFPVGRTDGLVQYPLPFKIRAIAR